MQKAMGRLVPTLLSTLLTAALLLAGAGTAAAQGMAGERTGTSPTGIRWLTTGVGAEHRMAHPDYSVKVVFAERGSGAYVADVGVRVYNADGEMVMQQTSEGPWFYLDLAPGTYTIRATRNTGDATATRVTVEGGSQRVLNLTFPQVENA